jgi:hypothetical protein
LKRSLRSNFVVEEFAMRKKMIPAVIGFSLLAALVAGNAQAQRQSRQVQARVISATQVTEADGRVGYDVTYEYNGRQYNTRTDRHPGAAIPIEVSPYGVATLPVGPQPDPSSAPAADSRAPWEDVVPEPGVVVSAGGAPAPAYYDAPPAYGVPAYPAPVYAAPMYVQPAYGYPAPYFYPPIGLSLNLGYSRGWHGHGGRWR